MPPEKESFDDFFKKATIIKNRKLRVFILMVPLFL